MKVHALWCLALLAIPGCADRGEGPAPRGLDIRIAPLVLPDIVQACYRLTVYNTDTGPYDATTTVWSEEWVCADTYGDGEGSITYVGTCDADTATPPRLNTVELEVKALVADELPVDPFDLDDPLTPYWDEATSDLLTHPGDYFDPCLGPDFCRLVVPCWENQDTLVEFNLTVMRAARQGFFDVAVNFSDIFCSAKFDCQYPGDDPDSPSDDEAIMLLFDEDGVRRDTGILGFACTSGLENAGENGDTFLYMNDIRIRCTDDDNVTVYEATLETAAEGNPGNQGSPDMIDNGDDPDPALNDRATYWCQCQNGRGRSFCADGICDDNDFDDQCDDRCDTFESSPVPLGSGCTDDNATCEEVVYQYAIYDGDEFVDEDFEKEYWNIAVGFNVAAMDGLQCTLQTRATASDSDEFGEQGLPFNRTVEGDVYPWLRWNIYLNDPQRTGLTCGQNPVGGPALPALLYPFSGVFPEYTDLPDGTMEFDNCGHNDGPGFYTNDGICGGDVDT